MQITTNRNLRLRIIEIKTNGKILIRKFQRYKRGINGEKRL